MLQNEHKINIRPKEKSSNIEIFPSQFCDQPLPSKYIKKFLKRSSEIFNTQPVVGKNSLEFQQRKYHVKSGFNINRKYIIKGQETSREKDDPLINKSIFSRRVNSETKASKNNIQIENGQIQGDKSQVRINFAKKLIQDLKKQTFKMRKSSSRYSASKSTSKSVELSEKKLVNREKLIENSMQKLRPSFNINEVKFFSPKKSLGKIMNEAKSESSSNLFKSGKEKSIKLEEKIFQQIYKNNKNSEQILAKTLKKIASPLISYSEYIKGPNETKYEIKINFLNQYITLAEKQEVLAHVDFSSMKLLQSIYLCLIDIFSVLLTQSNSQIDKTFNYDIIKEYVGVYVQTYCKIKTEYILCEILFKNAKRKLSQFFLMQRIIFYWIIQLCQQQNISQHLADVKKMVNFLKLSEQLLTSIVNMLVENTVNKKAAQDSFIDTFKSLRLTRQLDKRLPSLRENIESINFHKKLKYDESFNELSGSFLELLANTDKEDNFDITTIFKLEQYFNWTTLMIPPLFYLPMNPSKPYTLVIDLDGTLIFYNQETRILKYRPYMDRFLQAMQKHFQLILFSSNTKERSDIIVKEIQRGDNIFAYRLYKSHMVFQQGALRKNVGYLGRNLQKLVFVDDQQKNTQWLTSNSFKIKSFTGDKQDKELLSLSDWLTDMISTQPSDIRGKIKKPQHSLDEIAQIDQVSSTIQASIEQMQGKEVFVHRKQN